MRFTDSHCHLADAQLLPQLPDIIEKAHGVGVQRFIVPATHRHDWQAVLSLHTLPQVAACALGIHPWWANRQTLSNHINELSEILAKNKEIWVGEIGLDFVRAQTSECRETQQIVFKEQLKLAQQHQRCVIIHNVKATQKLISIIQEVKFSCGGIVHAFSGSIEEAMQWTKRGFLLGLGSLLLNPNAKKVRELARCLPATAFVWETDSPFMLPNQINTPTNTATIAHLTAQLRGEEVAVLAEQVERNLARFINQTSN